MLMSKRKGFRLLYTFGAIVFRRLHIRNAHEVLRHSECLLTLLAKAPSELLTVCQCFAHYAIMSKF